ncbi:MAG: hypothetical protein HDS70_04820 [Bacteroidales bacterium]|nr:hypothetical protein [Bacteroidales bacterium]MBD5217795.1 hypothetical protein [Bacteroidales bacterium]MBD5221676.1 hypothetical protein [Bacteroidales bacterium]
MKSIKRPDIKGAVELKPLELNAIHFSDKHTRLTPETLAAHPACMSAKKSAD